METNTPKQFAVQLGALAALYASIISLITLLFSAVTIAIPDATDQYYAFESASDSIRFGFAMLVIFFPAYIVLTRMVNKERRRDASSRYLGLTRWLIYLSLLVGGAILLGDAVAVVYSFLNGELTLRFFLKAAILAVVITSAFFYYLLDARGYWHIHEKQSFYAGAVASLFVAVSLIVGFSLMESPTTVREQKIDEQQLNDLQDMQMRIGDFLATEGELPSSIDELYTVQAVPEAPESRSAYRYNRTEDGFELCAEFMTTSDDRYTYIGQPRIPERETPLIINENDWEHGTGVWCFARVVD